MRRELLLPKLGLTMTEGALLEWMVQPGQAFQEGQTLFVVESEKAANEIAADSDGVLLEILAQVGDTLPCGSVIAYWDDGEAGQADARAATPHAKSESHEQGQRQVQAVTPVEAGGIEPPSADTGKRIPVTPLARRLAQQHGVDLARVKGSGPRGRIRARDIMQSVQASQSSPLPASQVPAATELAGELRAPSNLERVTAERLTAAKQQVPHFYLSVDVEMSAVLALRAELNAAQSRKKLTINHFVLAAVGRALQDMPEVNRVWTDQGILSLASSDVGMAVDTDKGLLVPVLRKVGQQALGELADQAGDMITRARAGRLSGAEMRGGCITVSNAGMHDVSYMASIINPGQSMILGVGSIKDIFRPDEHGQPVIRREMGMVLSADHRVLDGVTGLKFLKCVAGYLAQPLALMVV